MLKILQKIGTEELATVYIAETDKGRVEFVESTQPPFTRDEKWVVIVSSLYGCPVECEMCDAGGKYQGKLTTGEILEQIDYLILNRYPDRNVPAAKFKIQFARVGEPALNQNVLEVLKKLPKIYNAPGLTPSISTVAPSGGDAFFDELIDIKNRLYPKKFQLQFSIHSTSDDERDRIIPIKKWGFDKIAKYGERFYNRGNRKITLNFVLANEYTIDPEVVRLHFSPEIFLVKMTPLNPTCRATLTGLRSAINADVQISEPEIATTLRSKGYEVLISIGETEENLIGSNCGQFIKTFEEYTKSGKTLGNSYTMWQNNRS